MITIYHFSVLIGGGAGALDSVDGDSLVDGDRAFVMTIGAGDVFYAYYLDADSGLGESSPARIVPDTNAGDKVWIRQTTS